MGKIDSLLERSYKEAKNYKTENIRQKIKLLLILLVLWISPILPIYLVMEMRTYIIFRIMLIILMLSVSYLGIVFSLRYFDIKKFRRAGISFGFKTRKLVFSKKLYKEFEQQFGELQLLDFKSRLFDYKIINNSDTYLKDIDLLINIALINAKILKREPLKILGLPIYIAALVAITASFIQFFLQYESLETVMVLWKLFLIIAILGFPVILIFSNINQTYMDYLNSKSKRFQEISKWLMEIKYLNNMNKPKKKEKSFLSKNRCVKIIFMWFIKICR